MDEVYWRTRLPRRTTSLEQVAVTAHRGCWPWRNGDQTQTPLCPRARDGALASARRLYCRVLHRPSAPLLPDEHLETDQGVVQAMVAPWPATFGAGSYSTRLPRAMDGREPRSTSREVGYRRIILLAIAKLPWQLLRGDMGESTARGSRHMDQTIPRGRPRDRST